MKRLLEDARLLTLTGVAGVGKTRLALALVTGVRRAFRDGVWFIDLSAVGTPELVAPTVVTALGLDRESGDDALSILVDALGNRRALLVLDNCEHILDRCAEIAQTVLRSAADMRILVTSRETLKVAGEQVMPLGPLSLPPENTDPRPETLRRFDAVALFEQRVKSVVPDFALTAENAVTVAQLCHRLDGLPLAIELAASVVPAIGLAEMERRLDDRLRLLATSRIAGRHRSLQAALEWSYDLCTTAERLVWARASVFAGPFDLAAAEQVCAGTEVTAESVWEVIGGLVTKSVINAELIGDECRYRLLDTLRGYGQEHLRAIGEHAAVRRRHRDWFLQMAERCAAESLSPTQMQWVNKLPEHHSNLRAALEYCATEPGEGRPGLRLMSALWLYWMARRPGPELQLWFDRLLPVAPEPTVERAESLWWSVMFALLQGDAARLRPRAAECAEIARQHSDSRLSGMGSLTIGYIAMFDAEYPRAEQLFAAAIAEMDEAGWGMHPPALVAYACVSFCAAACGGYDRAEQWVERARVVAAEIGDRYLITGTILSLAAAKQAAGFPDDAARYARECLRIQRELHDTRALMTMELLTRTAAAAGRFTDAAVLIGAVEQIEETAGLSVLKLDFIAQARATCRGEVQQALGQAAFGLAVAQGRSLDVEEAVAFALGEPLPEVTPAGPNTEPLGSLLSRREHHVAQLIADGLSNKQIAARLVIAPRTAESHVEHILTKLGFTSRAQIATWVMLQQHSAGANGEPGGSALRPGPGQGG